MGKKTEKENPLLTADDAVIYPTKQGLIFTTKFMARPQKVVVTKMAEKKLVQDTEWNGMAFVFALSWVVTLIIVLVVRLNIS